MEKRNIEAICNTSRPSRTAHPTLPPFVLNCYRVQAMPYKILLLLHLKLKHFFTTPNHFEHLHRYTATTRFIMHVLCVKLNARVASTALFSSFPGAPSHSRLLNQPPRGTESDIYFSNSNGIHESILSETQELICSFTPPCVV